jgi:hypothetical protein
LCNTHFGFQISIFLASGISDWSPPARSG